MFRVFYASAVILQFCSIISATCVAEEKSLSGDQITTNNGPLVIHPVNHATFVMQWNGKTIYVDPVGGGKRFTDLTQYARAIALSYPTGKD
jgi:hypothetical protein